MHCKPLLTFVFLALAGAVPRLSAQEPDLEVALRDGRVLAVRGIAGQAKARWRLEARQGAAIEVAADSVLAVHGGAAQPSRLPAVHLAGGDVLRGLIVGGDATGDTLTLQSPVLGRRSVPVDRVECIVLQPDVAQARDLELPAGVDEVLFERAALGFDRVAGTLHQFGDQGVHFQPDGAPAARWYGERELVGLRLRGAVPPGRAAAAELVTRTGDRLGVTVAGFADRALQVQFEDGGEATIPAADLACLTLLAGATFLSSLEPSAVREASWDGDVLLPWRRDASVTGGPLVAAGRTHGRGLGVHSRSRLEFTVPEGQSLFLARVAFDDAALRLPVRGVVDLRVLLDDKIVWEQQGHAAAGPPRSTGLLPVQKGQRLALEVDFAGGRDLGDRVNWLSPVFLPAPGK